MSIPMRYDEKVNQRSRNPINVGTMDKNDPTVGTGMVGAPECGDVMVLQIRVDPENQSIVEAKFKTFGCRAALASACYATELLYGKSLQEASSIKNSDISGYLSLPPVKTHCSVLAQDAIKSAVEDYLSKQAPCSA